MPARKKQQNNTSVRALCYCTGSINNAMRRAYTLQMKRMMVFPDCKSRLT